MTDEHGQEEILDAQTEARVTLALRALPERRAPATLESRVLEQIARRAALPWWRQGFDRWPAAARVAFAFASAVLVVLTVVVAGKGTGVGSGGSLGVSRALSSAVLHDASTFFVIARTLRLSLNSVISSGWVVGCLAASAVLYAAFFGLAIAGYRTLYLHADREVRP